MNQKCQLIMTIPLPENQMENPAYWTEENQTSDGRFVIREVPGLDRTTLVCSIHGEIFNGTTCFWYESKEAILFRGKPLCYVVVHQSEEGVGSVRCARHEELWSTEHYEETGQCLYLTPREIRYLTAEQEAYKCFYTQISWQTIDDTSNAEISTSNGQIYVAVREESNNTRGAKFPPHIARHIASAIHTAADDAERQQKAIENKEVFSGQA